MRWEGERQSDNVEDRRGGGGGGMLPIGIGRGGGVGLGGVVLALVLGWVFGINPLALLGLMEGSGGAPVAVTAPATAPPAGDKRAAFVSTVLANTEDVWRSLLSQERVTYPAPRLVLFRGATPTACGRGQSAMGPFYCPADQRVYIDLDFFDLLARRMGAPGDFAQAYVIAHEVGHHVQQVLGVHEQAARAAQGRSQADANAISVRVELQADCLAGVWAHHSQATKGWLEPGDVEEALNAASRIGDDVLARQQGGAIVPESFTHGSSAQRVRWFRRGFDAGQWRQCDTLTARAP
ncbi:neutral zinc metallopeptidase [Aquabacterium sp. J223]|uniref:KPN_02809 family neutral zinc metallopeptidase n=1 Tax=Aquabacterium sp. J223 TaxID=2898431 RepID=UPI0021ADA170|nr:neutral zinc metallopeptidase [Aquabacterium sp. J223]UUX95425.1 neutral zinc metallopeptidase [Aquabacterium sp. J223]